MTKTALAGALEVRARSVQAWESDAETTMPSAEHLAALAKELNFPEEFFVGPDAELVEPESVSFRAISRLPAYRRDIATATGAIGVMFSEWLDTQFDLPTTNLPDLKDDTDPVRAAEVLRAQWGLGISPVPNLIHLCEAAGIRIFALVEECRSVDAFSFWRDERPFMFIDTTKSAERRRRDVAHELGHILLHRGHDVPRGRGAEDEADLFANHFLLPESAVIATQLYRPSLDRVLREKRKWRVSAMSMIRRLYEVDMITEWIYKRLCIEASKRGYRTKEDDIPAESSQLLAKVIGALRQEGVTVRELARQLTIDVRDLNDLIFGLALVPVDGLDDGSGARRADLRLVE